MTILPPDPYKILGVPKDVQITEIRSAYRKLVLKCHPDKIQDPALKEAKQIEFQQLQQAYELLSNENEREKYDRKVEVYEHVREREKEREREREKERERERERDRERARASAARAASSLPKQESIYYHVKEASPRANTFAKTGVYGSRSWEDTTAGARLSEEPLRYARKTASYEKEKSSKKDEERRKRKEEDELEREKEKAKEAARKSKERKEKDRAAREREDREKEKRKEEKKKSQSDREKERGKERKNASTEKIRARVIIEEDSDSSDSSEEDVVYEPAPKSERKKSSSGRKPEDVEPTSTERTRKLSGNMENAIRYLARSGGKATVPGFTRSQTYTEGSSRLFSPMVPVPTPPPAANAPFAPPPPPQVNEPEEISEDDDVARRSAARPSHRRMSHDTPKASREKTSSHKKPSSSRDHQPIIVEAGSPPARNKPSMSRAHTESYARPMPIPGLGRSETWYGSTKHEHERHERSRSRPTPATVSDGEESEGDRERRRRRSRRTQSPDPISSSHFQYAAERTKGMPIRQKQYHDQPPPRGAYKTKTAYVMPNSSARVQRGHPSYAHEFIYDDERPQQVFPDVKYAAQFDERDIKYSNLPYKASTYHSDVYA